MIVDTLANLGKYVSLNPLFADVVTYLQNHSLNTHEIGKFPIKGEDLFVNCTISKGKTKEQARIESHDRMIDIQIPVSAPETMGYTAREALPEAEYNAEKDITFYPGLAKTYVTVQPGEFAIFFPQDGHAPCVTDEPEIRKVIFKVKA